MRLSIIIATKNREIMLIKLLESLISSKKYLYKIIIVSSGRSIIQLISPYSKYFNIEHRHIQIENQVIQKVTGIKMLDNDTEWVLFLDDDVLVSTKTIPDLINYYLDNKDFGDVCGFGLRVENTFSERMPKIMRFILRKFKLYSEIPGVVLKSGHAQNYLISSVDTDTEWLNGVSVWKHQVISKYSQGVKGVNYSAYEDVIFSHRVSKECRLLYAARITVLNQQTGMKQDLSLEKYIAGTIMRYYFVITNENLSLRSLLLSQLVRSIDFVLRGDSETSLIKRLRKGINVLYYLIVAITLKRDAEFLAKKLN